MKNHILRYSSYSDKIFKGNDIEIKIAYFSGITFNPELEICFICFDAITTDNRPIILKFRMDFESGSEYRSYFLSYVNNYPSGMTISRLLPILVATSCFYKQHSDRDEWYVLYAVQPNSEDQYIFKVIMSRNIFCQIMFMFNYIRKRAEINESNISILNKFNYFKPDTEMIKLAQYEPSINIHQKLYCKKPSRFVDTFVCYCIVTFTKGERSFNIALPIKVKNVYRKYKDKFITSINDLEKEMIDSEIPSFFITDAFPIEFSISADSPMSKFIFVGLSAGCDYIYKYFYIPDEMVDRMSKVCFNYIVK